VRNFSAIDRKNRTIRHRLLFIEDFVVGFWSQLLDECECAIYKKIHHPNFEIIIFDEQLLLEIFNFQCPKNICCDV